MKSVFGLAPNAFLLGLVSLFNDFSAEMIYAVMPAFLVGVLAAPPIVLGLIEGFADAISSILKIFSGWLSDKIKKRKAITARTSITNHRSQRCHWRRLNGSSQLVLGVGMPGSRTQIVPRMMQ